MSAAVVNSTATLVESSAKATRHKPHFQHLAQPEIVQYADDSTIIQVCILVNDKASSAKSATKLQHSKQFINIKLSHVIQRELEMQAVALSFDIQKDRWNGSLLYTLWKEQGKTSITLNPELECAKLNYSSCLHWDTWLTSLVQHYYETGLLRISEQCQGIDLLLSLEYFGILYQPNQLVFDSFPAYTRVKLWSDFFTHRAAMADWIAEVYGQNQQQQQNGKVYITTTPVTYHEPLHLHGSRLIVFDGGMTDNVEAVKYRELVHQFFNAPDNAQTAIVAPIMRQDFCSYLQNLLVHVIVTFDVHYLDAPNNFATAVLCVERTNTHGNTTTRAKSDLTSPIDEQVDEDIKQGKLESLLNDSHYKLTRSSSNTSSPKLVVDDIYRDLESEVDIKTLRASVEHEREKLDRLQSDAMANFASKGRPAIKKSKSTSAIRETRRQRQQMMLDTERLEELQQHRNRDMPMSDNDDDEDDPTLTDDLESEIMRNPAPVMMVHAESSDNKSITSAITGPFFIDDDGELRDVYGDDEEIRAQALRHEWIQGSILNRDIAKRIKELLEAEEVQESRYKYQERHCEVTEQVQEWISTLWSLSCGAIPGTTEQVSSVCAEHQAWLEDAFADHDTEAYRGRSPTPRTPPRRENAKDKVMVKAGILQTPKYNLDNSVRTRVSTTKLLEKFQRAGTTKFKDLGRISETDDSAVEDENTSLRVKHHEDDTIVEDEVDIPIQTNDEDHAIESDDDDHQMKDNEEDTLRDEVIREEEVAEQKDMSVVSIENSLLSIISNDSRSSRTLTQDSTTTTSNKKRSKRWGLRNLFKRKKNE